MIDFKIDTEKCIQCNKCAKDCPVLIIDGKTEYPEIKEGKEKNCIRCQHCLAVCPTGALSILGKNPEDSALINERSIDPKDLKHLVQSRRSVRRFKAIGADKALIKELVSTASYAPTSKNDNAIKFTVFDDAKILSKFRELVYTAIKREEENIPVNLAFLTNFQNIWFSRQIDILFRNAPHLIITSAPAKTTNPKVDGCIAMSYFELIANSNGIGTLWNGFLKWVLNDIAPELKASIGIPEDHVISEIMLFGYPAVKYARSIQNDTPDINTVAL